jgi:HAD superfamily hydrolase (TIGR01509 family)
MGSELRALVFDFDGTIAETERDGHRLAYNAAFEELELPWRWDEGTYGALLATAGGKERLRGFIAEARPALAAAAVAALAAEIHEVKRRKFGSLASQLSFRPGIRRLAREARAAGVALAIATTAALDGVTALLAHDAELRAAFATISAGDVVAHKKPAPDIYLHVLAALGVAPSDAVAFEDSAIGVRAASAAGLVTVVTPSVYTAHESFAGATAVLSDLGEPGAHVATLYGPAPPRGFVDLAYVRALLA